MADVVVRRVTRPPVQVNPSDPTLSGVQILKPIKGDKGDPGIPGIGVSTTQPGISLPGGAKLYDGSVAPEGIVTANPGDLYLRTTGEHWLKVAGTGNTGWYQQYPILAGPTPPANTTVLWLDTT
jgi:hypothetical protein